MTPVILLLLASFGVPHIAMGMIHDAAGLPATPWLAASLIASPDSSVTNSASVTSELPTTATTATAVTAAATTAVTTTTTATAAATSSSTPQPVTAAAATAAAAEIPTATETLTTGTIKAPLVRTSTAASIVLSSSSSTSTTVRQQQGRSMAANHVGYSGGGGGGAGHLTQGVIYPGKDLAVPCRLLPWSGYRSDASRLFYVLSNSSVWFHQAETGGWTELRSTLVTPFVDGWTVRCDLPAEQAIVVANASLTLVYHRTSAKWWNLSGMETDYSQREDPKLVWCHRGAVHVYSPSRQRLLRHDARSLKVITSRARGLPFNYSIGRETRIYSWFLPRAARLYSLVELPRNGSSTCNCSLLMLSSVAGGQNELAWTIVDQWSYQASSTFTANNNNSTYSNSSAGSNNNNNINGHNRPRPGPSSKALTWSDGSQSLWLWLRPSTAGGGNEDGVDSGQQGRSLPSQAAISELWQFSLDVRQWRRRPLEPSVSNSGGSSSNNNNNSNASSQRQASVRHRNANNSKNKRADNGTNDNNNSRNNNNNNKKLNASNIVTNDSKSTESTPSVNDASPQMPDASDGGQEKTVDQYDPGAREPIKGERHGGQPLLGWMDGLRSCTITAPLDCREPFSLVRSSCVQVTTAGGGGSERRSGGRGGNGSSKGPKLRPSRRPPRVQLLSTMKPSKLDASVLQSHPATDTAIAGNASANYNGSSVISQTPGLWSEEATPDSTDFPTTAIAPAVTTEDLADEEVDGDELDLELDSPWHDSESGIFDSIVFCVTSAVVLSLVSALWCVRHCAPFPKEALLPLRDPPSVRYTAIPDHTLA